MADRGARLQKTLAVLWVVLAAGQWLVALDAPTTARYVVAVGFTVTATLHMILAFSSRLARRSAPPHGQ